jgi:hypothetical protein
MTGIYTDTDKNYRMYNGDQWGGAKLGEIEPVQKNFIKPIVKYKQAVIHSNLYAIKFESQNYEDKLFRKNAERFCEMLNGYAARVWERDKMDSKGRQITKDAAINDEGILYVDFDKENMNLVNEVIDKNDIYYANENDADIQSQPYILIRKRMPVSNAVEFAQSKGLSDDKLEMIIGDNDTFDQAGEAAKIEVDNAVTIVYKLYRDGENVHYSVSTRWVDILEDVDLGIKLFPIAHMNWEDKKGSARGEGEVRHLIPNQIEVNKTEMRRLLTVKNEAYPRTVVDTSKIDNISDLDRVGGIIETNGTPVDDVRKVVGTIPPAQMSRDVVELQEGLINVTRDLAGAGDAATGEVDPESASGRAILAVQQASQAPMTEQRESFKSFIEDVARIWLEYLIAYSDGGIEMQEEVTDPATGETTIQLVKVPQTALRKLQANVKVEITPKGVYDRFAQEQTIENLLIQGFFNIQRLSELKVYTELLDDDSVAPKMKLKEAIEHIENEQRKIAMIQAQAQMMQQNAQRFIMGDPNMQASMITDARAQLAQGNPAAQTAMAEAETDKEKAKA